MNYDASASRSCFIPFAKIVFTDNIYHFHYDNPFLKSFRFINYSFL